jgi:hypothetical protein
MLKHGLLLIVSIALIASQTSAQITPTVVKLATGKAYVLSQSDTSKAVRVASGSVISSLVHVLDSVSVYRTVQYCKSSAAYADANWTLAKKDTITTTAAGYSELVLRNATTEAIGGVGGWTRVILDFQATANGVTSATYDNWIYVR